MPKYNIPENRTVKTTIPLTNGSKLTGEVDDSGNVYWFRDNKYITPYVLSKYKFYDKSIGGYRTLYDKRNGYKFYGDKPTSVPYTPNFDKLMNMAYSDINYRNEQNIPTDNQKVITLRTKGKMNLADVPVNMLDSIAVNAGRAGTDFYDSAALVGKESTFGGYSDVLGRPLSMSYGEINPWKLTNNHSYFTNPYEDYMGAVFRKYDFNDDKEAIKADKDIEYAFKHNLIKQTTPRYSDYVLADAFKRYSVNPAKYNPGQSNYVPMLNSIKKELQGEKQIQNYWSTRGKKEYARGQREERRRLESRGKKVK